MTFEDYLIANKKLHLIRAASIARLSSGERRPEVYWNLLQVLYLWNPQMSYQAEELWWHYRQYWRTKNERKSDFTNN